MSSPNRQLRFSIVVPCYNEEDNIKPIFDSVQQSLSLLSQKYSYEIIFVDDGSTDNTVSRIKKLPKLNPKVVCVELSKNFGKEAATTAGINSSKAEATIIIDADGQHPPGHLPKMIELWEKGAKVVVGIRSSNQNEGFIKKYGSLLFYNIFNKVAHTRLIPGSTDFRLIDREVRDEFNKLTEKNRITRGLIDWLGFETEYIFFKANERIHGEASYTFKKLVKLALTSFVSLSFLPLFIMGYVGFGISLLSFVGGGLVLLEVVAFGDPMNLNITGSGYLGILILFLVGIILVSQALISLYISYIYQEVQGRPLYIKKT